MKAIVDQETCTGCGLCPSTCPEVFQMDGDVAKTVADAVPKNVEDAVREAAEGCPVEAISIQ